jgi:hypothetical protein
VLATKGSVLVDETAVEKLVCKVGRGEAIMEDVSVNYAIPTGEVEICIYIYIYIS